MDEPRCVAVLELIADLERDSNYFRTERDRLSEQIEYREARLENVLNELGNVKQTLSIIEANLETALNENVDLERGDIETLLEIIRKE